MTQWKTIYSSYLDKIYLDYWNSENKFIWVLIQIDENVKSINLLIWSEIFAKSTSEPRSNKLNKSRFFSSWLICDTSDNKKKNLN